MEAPTTEKKKKPRPRPELSVFDSELNVPFNPKEFEPDIPPYVKAAQAAANEPFPPAEAATEPRTNLGQTSDKLGTNPGINLGQTWDKPRTPAIPAPPAPEETSDKLRTQPRTASRTNLGQTSDKLGTKYGFVSLVGLQHKIALFIYEQSKSARDRITDPISIFALASSCETTVLSAQKTIQRLEQKGIVRRAEHKNGRGGWTKYELPQDVFQEVMHLETSDKLRTYFGHTSDKVRSQPRTQLRTSVSSSSSSSVFEELKTTTTVEPELLKIEGVSLAPEWTPVDFSPLAEIGFTQTHLIQIIRQGKLSPQEVQDSIEFFTFDLKRNGLKPNGPPLNFFMGILRKGIPYAPPENYESPADEARRKTIEFKARKEREREAQLKQLVDLEFTTWRHGLSAEQVAAMVPEYAKKPGPMQDSFLRELFTNEIWPAMSATIPGMSEERAAVQKEIERSLGEVNT